MADVWDRARLVTVPLQLADGQLRPELIGGGGLEDVTREVGGFGVELAEFEDAGPTTQDAAFGQGEQAQIVEEAV